MSVPMMLYFADPMCSWCWGFAPTMDRIRERFGDNFDVQLIAGGLSPHETKAMDAHTRDAVREHWQHVTEASGQPFDLSFFEREDFIYNTEPPCRALVTARLLEPGSEFRVLHALHVAFYAANRDVTNAEVIADLAHGLGFDRDVFLATFEDQNTRLATGNDFMMTQSLGIRGFPALVIGDEAQGLSAVTVGYQPFDALTPLIDGWLAEQGQD